MIRKSKEQRIADVQAALPRWEAAGRTREVTFMRDMVARLQGDKGLSPRQRTWLDELSAAAPPPPPEKNLSLISRCDAALPHSPTGDARRVIQDMAERLKRGWWLSERQTAFLERLLGEAERAAQEGPWQPDPATLAEGLFAARIVTSRGGAWKSTHPGTVSAARRILLAFGSEGADPGLPGVPDHPDAHCFKKAIGSVGPAVREFRQPRFQEGDMVVVREVLGAGAPAGSLGMVVSGPVAHAGEVHHETLIGGRPVRVPSRALRPAR